MKWSLLIALAFVLAFAPPASAESRVFGLAVDLTRATAAPSGYAVWLKENKDASILVRATAGCGAPASGAAYMQYVKLDDGTEYRTLYALNCAYEILP